MHLQGKPATYPYLSERKGFHVSPLEVGDSVRMKFILSLFPLTSTQEEEQQERSESETRSHVY